MLKFTSKMSLSGFIFPPNIFLLFRPARFYVTIASDFLNITYFKNIIRNKPTMNYATVYYEKWCF